ncbi:MAG: glycogen synthase GlgA [Oscillospiraceae bacterium]
MKSKPKILFATFEAEPFMKTGGLGDVAGSLPKAISASGGNIRVIMPKFSGIPEKYKVRMKHIADFYLNLSWRKQYCGIDMLRHLGVVYYFVDNMYYFDREKPYGYYDDGERIAFFSQAVLQCIQYLPDFFPDILHLNDWHTAAAAALLRSGQYADIPGYDRIKTVFTVHNLKFQGVFPEICAGELLGLSREEAVSLGLIYGDTVNYMRGGLSMSDRLTTVSPSYADEVCSDFFGEKAQDIFRSRRGVLYGILNGIDTKKYDPAADKSLAVKYDAKTLENKKRNKELLQAEIGLCVNGDTPVIALISRLTEQKGLDLVLCILDELLGEDLQLAVLGVGDKKYEDELRSRALASGGKMSAMLMFDEGLSHRFYAAADMVMVPSLFEPCGLSQMMAMRYGALPVVRETGGLRDSVIPYNKFTGEGTGFSFANFNAHELLFTIKEALRIYREDGETWDALVKNAMAEDFSWSASAEAYMALYRELLAPEEK